MPSLTARGSRTAESSRGTLYPCSYPIVVSPGGLFSLDQSWKDAPPSSGTIEGSACRMAGVSGWIASPSRRARQARNDVVVAVRYWFYWPCVPFLADRRAHGLFDHDALPSPGSVPLPYPASARGALCLVRAHPRKGNDGDVWYNDTSTGASYRTYCYLCPATYACNSTGLSEPDVLCGEGYYCKQGAESPTPTCQAGSGMCDYGICPEGHYCPTGTSDPVICPAGERRSGPQSQRVETTNPVGGSQRSRCGEPSKTRR